MFSQTVEYALRGAVYLANTYPSPRTAEQIAEATLVPQAYVSKVLQNLTRCGLVHSQRGLHGGFSLTKEPVAVTVLEVVNAVDPIRRILTCPLELATHGAHLCPLHRRLDHALAMVEKSFDETTLAQILAEPSGSVPLCNAPPKQPPKRRG